MNLQGLSDDLAAIAAGGRPEWDVAQVVPASPAARAGLVAGDRILGINGRLFRHPGELIDWLDCLVPDQTLVIHVSQGGEPLACTLTVGRPPIQEQAA